MKNTNERYCGFSVSDAPCSLISAIQSIAGQNRRSMKAQILTILEEYAVIHDSDFRRIMEQKNRKHESV